MAGCAGAAPSVGARVTLTGEVHVKGNEPFPTVVLQTDDHTVWELVGVPVDAARALAGQRVQAPGTVLRAPGHDTWMPALRVEAGSLRLVQP
ncbi:hypothetical protein AWV80_09070 [Cupriavidus sp. UYMU48A]|nr:hypothetical protein AWV80_09070 [Cupriavidus sp. UYMU48A]